MTLTKKEIVNLIPRHITCLFDWQDVMDAVAYVSDLLEAEAKATEREEPYASNAINRYMNAARTLRKTLYDLEAMEYEEEDENE